MRKRERERAEGGVAPVSGHMTRKMWGLIPVLDCSQLLRFCPSQCKPHVLRIATPDPRVDSPLCTMSGECDTHGRRIDTRTRPPAPEPSEPELQHELCASPETSRLFVYRCRDEYEHDLPLK